MLRASTFTYNDKGVLSQEVANMGTDVALTKNYGYDTYGNKVSETIFGTGVPIATTNYSYGVNGKFKTGITNAEGMK